jgi:hypothetical protein
MHPPSTHARDPSRHVLLVAATTLPVAVDRHHSQLQSAVTIHQVSLATALQACVNPTAKHSASDAAKQWPMAFVRVRQT